MERIVKLGDNPKISVIIPVYGVEKFIEKCVVSLLEQTYSNLELLFVDDATPDRSVEIIQRYGERTPGFGSSGMKKTRVCSGPGLRVWRPPPATILPSWTVTTMYPATGSGFC